MNYIKGNLFDSKADVLCHQTNTFGVMGAGIAAEVRHRFPNVYYEYKSLCDVRPVEELLGTAFIVSTDENENQFIANCFGQFEWRTNYKLIKDSLINVKDWMIRNNKTTVAIPYKMSCGLARGDWNIVEGIIEDVFKDIEVEIWELT